jgi:uncharacterized repeat protein (TIGR01451 family)
MHSAYETTALNAHIGEISIPADYLPQQLDNVLGAALASLAKSFTYTAEGANPGDNNLTDFLENGITWNSWIKSMTENRLRSAVQFTANVWYSAMIQAGLTIQAPTLTSPSNGSSTTDNTPTFTWTSVSGTNSYDFQLASDNNFTINARTAKGLSTTSYTPVTPLTNGRWYWHVRTGDNSADVGLFSQTRSFTVTVATQNPVVVISPSSNSGPNGALLTYTVTVTNTGNASDNFNLTVSDNAVPSWGPTVSPTSLTVPPGENRPATLSVTVPSNAIGGTIDNIKVKATSQADNTVSGSGSCIAQVTISRGISVSISPSSQNGTPGSVLSYTVTVNNTGNVSDTYTLTPTDNAIPTWSPSVPSPLVVAAFSSGNATLSVTIPSGATVGTIDNIRVTANGTGDNTSSSCTAQAVMIIWTGTATFNLENLYAVGLEKDLQINAGSKLVAKFYTYGGSYQDNTVLETFTPPVHIMENENVSRPGNGPIQRVDLAVVDNEGNELEVINILETSSTVLVSRVGQINALWPFASEAQRAFYTSELGSTNGLWPFAPGA